MHASSAIMCRSGNHPDEVMMRSSARTQIQKKVNACPNSDESPAEEGVFHALI